MNSEIEPADQTPTQAPTQAPLQSLTPLIRPLGLRSPLTWLYKGFCDFLKAPGIGLFFGTCFVVMAWALWGAFRSSPATMLTLSAGFLLVGPFLCMGLYQVSMKLERHEKPSLGEAALAWQHSVGTMAIFGGVLLILEMLWARASLVVFAVALEGPIPQLKPTLDSLLNPNHREFILAWIGLGGLFAGLIFSICVISIPMILDRGTDAITAALTSLKLVIEKPLVLLLWGFLISVLVTGAMVPGFLGLLVVGPIVGHASWHAYKDAVE